jgi:hypothetical protein
MTRRLGWVSLVLAAIAALMGTLTSRPTDAAMSRDKRLQLIPAVPLIVTMAARSSDGKVLGIISFGSGTVVTPRGHIFTNNHVISFGHDVPAGITIMPERYVYLTFKNNEDPQPICTFDPSHMPSDRKLDIAMVMCEHDLKGNPWDPNKVDWPFVPMGIPSDMVQGDDLWIFGYPGAGVDPRKKGTDLMLTPTMNVSAGKFSGVVNEDAGGSKKIMWLKTDAEVSGGNSGGCATDDDGNYMGVPTEVHTDTRGTDDSGDGGTLGHVSFLRPVSLYAPYYEAAKQGWTPNGSGGISNNGGQQGNNGNNGGPGLGNNGQQGGNEPMPGDGVTVSGIVTSEETGAPVQNVVVLVFKAGVTSKQVLASDDPGQLIFTNAKTDRNGNFQLADKLPKGRYTAALVAQGYKLVIEDDAVVVNADTPKNFKPWPRITVAKCSSGPDCIR